MASGDARHNDALAAPQRRSKRRRESGAGRKLLRDIFRNVPGSGATVEDGVKER
jgi:hypothetical protein